VEDLVDTLITTNIQGTILRARYVTRQCGVDILNEGRNRIKNCQMPNHIDKSGNKSNETVIIDQIDPNVQRQETPNHNRSGSLGSPRKHIIISTHHDP
jgi:hypothetical protein